ncbi:MAG TPA: Mrp/NBP35 family ATP-binding protein [Vicinamibacterales bacterium]|jgi:ATP-binding protein involved in chromosome partitioning|nr:Mrp/NBP35 family ATP-binding protein [Vicinamibacterales bacterium]
MRPSPDQAAVLDALRVVIDPDLGKDIVSLGFVKRLAIDASGAVRFAIELTTPACPVKDRLKAEAEQAVTAVAGVTSVDIEMTAAVRTAALPDGARQPVAGVKNVIAVGAGKGGVGKTTVAVNLAVALAQMGSRVGMIDGDIYGPNVPMMLGLHTELVADEQGRIIPAERYGVRVVSMGFLTQEDSAVIWRGPMLHGAIQQFFRQVVWDNLDYLIVDLPPGTGDVALSLSQSVPVSGAIVVTTPQQVALADTRRAVRMYQKLNIRPLGLIENMSHFECPNCGHESDIFGRGAGEGLAHALEIPFLGRLPIYEPIRIGGDGGHPIVLAEPDSAAARAFRSVAEQAAAQISIASYSRVIPLTPVR